MSQIVTPPILSSNLSYLIPPNNNNVFSYGYGSSIITANSTKTDSITPQPAQSITTNSIDGATTGGGTDTGGGTNDGSQQSPTPLVQTQNYTNLKTALKINDCGNFNGTTSGYYGLVMTLLSIILIWSLGRWGFINGATLIALPGNILNTLGNIWCGGILNAVAGFRLPLSMLDLSMVVLPIIYISLYSVFYKKYKSGVDTETIMKIIIVFSIFTIISLFFFGYNFLNLNTTPGLQIVENNNSLRQIMYAAQLVFLGLFNFLIPYLLFKDFKKKETNLVNQMFVIIIVANILYVLLLIGFSMLFTRPEVNWSLFGIFVFWMVAYGYIYQYMMGKQQYAIDDTTPLNNNWSIKFLYYKCYTVFIIIMLYFLYFGVFRKYGGGDIRLAWSLGNWDCPAGNDELCARGYMTHARTYFLLFWMNVILNFSLLGILIHTYIRTYVCSKTTSS